MTATPPGETRAAEPWDGVPPEEWIDQPWHLLQFVSGHRPEAVRWNRELDRWEWDSDAKFRLAQGMYTSWIYVEPLLPPSEVSALKADLAAARKALRFYACAADCDECGGDHDVVYCGFVARTTLNTSAPPHA